MTLATCSHCGVECDSRLVKPVAPPDFPDGGVACYGCRDQWGEIDDLHEQDRIDAARWRALRPFLMLVTEELPIRWVELKCVPFRSGGTVDEIVDKLAQIEQEQKP